MAVEFVHDFRESGIVQRAVIHKHELPVAIVSPRVPHRLGDIPRQTGTHNVCCSKLFAFVARGLSPLTSRFFESWCSGR